MFSEAREESKRKLSLQHNETLLTLFPHLNLPTPTTYVKTVEDEA